MRCAGNVSRMIETINAHTLLVEEAKRINLRVVRIITLKCSLRNFVLDWIQLAQDRDQWRTLVKTVM
jgi:hypothetical protein